MKIKSVLASIVAVAALSATSIFATADGIKVEVGSVEDLTGGANAANGDAAPAETAGADKTASDKDNPDSGVEGVAAVVGAIALAGAAVVISRKRA